MQLLQWVKKIPGGLMLVPMATAVVIQNVCPAVLQVGAPMTSLFTNQGTMCIAGAILVFAGIQTEPQNLIRCMKRSGVLILLKLVLNIACAMGLMTILGRDGIFGISSLALIVCLFSCNAGLYLALMQQYGTQDDIAGFTLLSIIGLPFVPVCALTWSSGAGIDWRSLLATILPYLIGMALGLLDPEIRRFSQSGNELMLPFLGFCLGTSVRLDAAVQAISTGCILFLLTMVLNLFPLLIVEKLILHGKGCLSASIATVAGLTLAVPSLIEEVDPSYAIYKESAIPQMAVAVIFSAIVTPFFVKWLAEKGSRTIK